jgi:hypothetical protein
MLFFDGGGAPWAKLVNANDLQSTLTAPGDVYMDPLPNDFSGAYGVYCYHEALEAWLFVFYGTNDFTGKQKLIALKLPPV